MHAGFNGGLAQVLGIAVGTADQLHHHVDIGSGGHRQGVGVTANAVLFGLFHLRSVGIGNSHQADGAPRAAFDNFRLLRQQLEGAAAYGAEAGDAYF